MPAGSPQARIGQRDDLPLAVAPAPETGPGREVALAAVAGRAPAVARVGQRRAGKGRPGRLDRRSPRRPGSSAAGGRNGQGRRGSGSAARASPVQIPPVNRPGRARRFGRAGGGSAGPAPRR